jgi:CDP-diacylglycerol--glycerol-3-phosphate 3-phosphatidyltransferase
MKRYIPLALTTVRLLLGPVALIGAVWGIPRWIYLPILVVATWSDIYDGILARRYGVSTVALRRYDSSTDLIFYLFILAAAWRLCHEVLQKTWWAIAAVLVTEGLLVLICFLRFRKYPAAHSYLAKFFGLCLLFCLTALLGFNASAWAVYTIGVVGVATNVEIIVMHLVAETAPVDVRSIVALLRSQRREKEKRAALKAAH